MSVTNWNVSVLHVEPLMIGSISVGVWPASWPATIVPPWAALPLFGSVPVTSVPSSETALAFAAACPIVFFALLAPVRLTATAATAARATARLISRGRHRRPAPVRFEGLNLIYSYPFGLGTDGISATGQGVCPSVAHVSSLFTQFFAA